MERVTRLCLVVLPLILSLLCAICRPACAGVVYVNRNAPGAVQDGKSWGTAFTAVAPAVAAAASGDEVWVAAGTYGDRIAVRTALGLYGGFSGVETNRDQRNWTANRTMLRGAVSFGIAGGPSVPWVIDGFTLKGYGYSASTSGIHASMGSLRVSNCTIRDCDYGLYTYSAAVEVANCNLSENYDAIYCDRGGSATLTNCTITGNTRRGVYLEGASTITNCIVAFNGGGITWHGSGSAPTCSHNNVYATGTLKYSGFSDPTGTNGNISSDPKLSNIYHDVHIQPGSPCIDAGDNDAEAGPVDFYGKARRIGARVDIGADESDGTVWPVAPRVWYVSKTGDDANDGTSWSRAKKTITEALALAEASDEVWVARGIFPENVIVLSSVALYGGFSGTEASRDQRNWKANVSTIDGSGLDVVSPRFAGVILDGFTVRNGRNGVMVDEHASVAVANCVISANSMRGVHMWGGPATVTNCVVSGNGSDGIMVQTGPGVVTNCQIIGNAVDGIVASSSVTVSGCTLTGNYNGFRGGAAQITDCIISGSNYGIYATGTVTASRCAISGNYLGVYATGTTTIRSSTIERNTVGLYAGDGYSYNLNWATAANCSITANRYGVYANQAGAAVTNCTISGNTFGYYVDYDGRGSVTNSIVSANWRGIIVPYGDYTPVAVQQNDVYGNTSADYSTIADQTGKNGNISKDPRLSNPYHDPHIQPGSPCTDAGLDSAVQSGWTDIDGQPRVAGAHVDIGSDESDGTAWTVAASTWYVSAHGDDANDGKSWARAKRTIEAALAGAEGPDEVWVAKGVYEGESVTIPPGVAVYGGFEETQVSRSQRDWTTNVSQLAGCATTTGQQSILDGFTVTGGRPGIYMYGAGTIANCTVSGDGYYEGIYVHYGAASITRCILIGNGYGVTTDNASASLTSCFVGGSRIGVRTTFGSMALANCTIIGNTVGVDAVADITNCIVAFNEKGIDMSGIGPARALSHNDTFGNTSANYANGVDPTGTNGNISVDPKFVDATRGNYRIRAESPCIDAGDNAVVTPGQTDLGGRPRIAGERVDIGAYEYVLVRPWSVPLGTGITGGLTVAERVAYVAANDGRLYARSTEGGSVVPGFPVDVSAAVGAVVKLPSRPSVYYGKTGKAIYLTTDRGDVLRILPTGQVAWHVRPLGGQTVSTPAVTPDGYVYVNLSTGSGPFNNYLMKLDEATGKPLNISPFLGYTTASDLGDFSPAANNRYLYVNAGWGSRSGLTVMNQDNLTVRSSFAAGEQCLSPLLLGNDLILASKGGKVWKMNAVTLSPDLGFGHFGVADVGGQISAAPFADATGNVCLGTVDGRILKWSPGAAGFLPFYQTSGRIAGLTINRKAGVLAFGTSSGSFVQVPLDNPAGAVTVTPGGPISTGAVYEALTDRFIVVTDGGVLNGYPSMR